ncbi:hypothetical protein J3E72DRAFT_300215 [Bipolaris maydis]|uniref:uncharacterized protein n=1 Tax=Cochliobolus heterostrophus TaxID=5016 RepID=UPI0024D07739|nr:hypothetical protein J3E73DRAFT_278636 [Bipolaris maydis]KAJ5065667.1 hypothetical protein J3E74DRAFT_303864 [Bipolaris maydis]KAJ6200870.1 hypothetical protein J3E72DRAFT_300215 [Bipolaris maydis]KAJ6274509.1 hypothetical protein PSV08DRAFT_264997 [Bipolaris maydis]KAJ6286209.1 hypothetical protein J3E71DRAFT_261276 [Bipolaris maydis]
MASATLIASLYLLYSAALPPPLFLLLKASPSTALDLSPFITPFPTLFFLLGGIALFRLVVCRSCLSFAQISFSLSRLIFVAYGASLSFVCVCVCALFT